MSNVVRSAAVRLTMENASYIRGARQADQVTAQATAGMQRSVRNAATSTGRDWDTMGKYGGRTALAIGAGLAFAEKKIISFDKTMSAAQAATRTQGQEFEALRSAAIKAGADTAFSASEAAQAIVEEGKAGISTANILSGGLRGALDLAAAGTIGVGEAAEYTATTLTQFKLGGEQARHVADLLAAGAGKAQGEVTDMALALSYVGVPAHAARISLEETVGTIALLAKNGLIGEKAGTSLRGMLASLQSPSKIATKVMSEYGISVFDTSGKLKGFDGIARELHTRLGGLTDQERQYALGKIFGNEQLQAANILFEEGARGVRRMTREVDDQGFATDTAGKKLDNLAGDWERFTGSLESAFIAGGSPAQQGLRDLVQAGEDVVNAFSNLPDEVQQGIVKVAVLTAGIGATLFAVSKIRNVARDLGGLGRGKGVAGGLGRVAASAGSPVPVYVVNLGPGGLGVGAGGGPLGVPLPGEKPSTAKPGKLGKVGAGIGKLTGFVGLLGALSFGASPDVIDQSKNKRFVIDDDFLRTHVVVNGRWYTKAAWAKEKVESNQELLWLVSGGRKGNDPKASQPGKDPLEKLLNPDRKGGKKKPKQKTSEDVLAELFGIDTRKLKPVDLLGDITGIFDVFGGGGKAKGGGKPAKNPVTQLSASLGLDTGAFDKKAKRTRRTAAELDALHPDIIVDADTTRALTKLQALINRDWSTVVNVLPFVHNPGGGNPAVKPAGGGLIVGPGTGTSDSIPAYVSNREYVVRAAAVAKYGVHMFDRINAMRFADGGLVGDPMSSYQAGAGVVVMFPAPSVLDEAVKAADAVAAAAASTVRSQRDIRQQNLDDLHTQQQIRDLQRDLAAKTKKGKLEVRGLDRKTAQAELAEAKATLAEIRAQADAAREEARQAAVAEQTQRRQDAADALSSAGDIFARGTSAASAVASVDRAVADIGQYGQVVAQLKAAGASPALLQQLINRAQQGEFRSAIRLGKALLAQPATLARLNTSLSTLGSVSSSVATMTTDPRFLSAGGWAPSSTSVVQVNVGLDPSAALQELRRVITFEVESALIRATR